MKHIFLWNRIIIHCRVPQHVPHEEIRNGFNGWREENWMDVCEARVRDLVPLSCSVGLALPLIHLPFGLPRLLAIKNKICSRVQLD